MWRGRLRPRVLRESGNFSRGLFDSRSSRERGGTRFLGVATWLCRVPGDRDRGSWPRHGPFGWEQARRAGRGGPSLCCPSSQLDVLTHRFITLLADTGDSRASENRVADANTACRKLAVAHPLLLLRYRPHAGGPPHPRPSRCFGASGPCLRSQRGLTAGSGPPADVWTCRRAEWPAGLGQSSRAVTTSDSAEPRWEGPERPQERAVSA